MIVCVWAATKALENDDQRLINAIHNAFLDVGEDIRDQLKEMFLERRARYNEAWDENSGGNQSILATDILSEMFNDGELDKWLLHFGAGLLVLFLVSSTMEKVLNYRKRIRLTE